MSNECQPLIDDYRRLKELPGITDTAALAEIRGILNIFQMNHAINPEVRSVVTSFIDCKDSTMNLASGQIVHDLIAIAAKYKGVCLHCQQTVNAGNLCLYDRSSKRLHCLLCDC